MAAGRTDRVPFPQTSQLPGTILFGSGAVLFSKPRSNIETVNDLDGDVVNLFQCIKKDPERLARLVYFTPFSRQIYDESYNRSLPKGCLVFDPL